MEKGDEDLTPSVAKGSMLPSSDNMDVTVGGDDDIGEADKEEGTSSASQVRVS